MTAHDSATALRLLIAYFAAKDGAEVTLTGSARLCSRPVGALVNSLRGLGADIEYAAREGFAPLHIRGCRLTGGEIDLDASASSQFASALAMIAPGLPGGLRVNLGGQIPSMPYLKMTLAMMQARGIDAHIEGYTMVVPQGAYKPVEAEVEPDWTAASYWYEMAAVSAGWITPAGYEISGPAGRQHTCPHRRAHRCAYTNFEDGNAELSATPDMYSRLDLDVSDHPDLVPALAVTACLVGMPFHFTGVANLRIKRATALTHSAPTCANSDL